MTDRKISGGVNLKSDKATMRDVVGRDNQTVNIIGDAAIDAMRQIAGIGSRISAADENSLPRPSAQSVQSARDSGVPLISLDKLRELEQQLESYVEAYLESHGQLVRCKAVQAAIERERDETNAFDRSWWNGIRDNLDQVSPLSQSLAQLLEIEEMGNVIKTFDGELEKAKILFKKGRDAHGVVELQPILDDFSNTIDGMVDEINAIMHQCEPITRGMLKQVRLEIEQIFTTVNRSQIGSSTSDEDNRPRTAVRPPDSNTSAATRQAMPVLPK